jgi:Crp-like helix-turn-helix domain
MSTALTPRKLANTLKGMSANPVPWDQLQFLQCRVGVTEKPRLCGVAHTANMLGVRHEGVTEAVLKLKHAGLIQYARGHITVLDRAGLEKRSCECYAVIKKEYGPIAPSHPGAMRRDQKETQSVR